MVGRGSGTAQCSAEGAPKKTPREGEWDGTEARQGKKIPPGGGSCQRGAKRGRHSAAPKAPKKTPREGEWDGAEARQGKKIPPGWGSCQRGAKRGRHSAAPKAPKKTPREGEWDGTEVRQGKKSPPGGGAGWSRMARRRLGREGSHHGLEVFELVEDAEVEHVEG